MIGFAAKGYVRSCSPVAGGVSNLWLGDAADFDFTEGTPGSDGDAVGYSTIARRTGATAIGGAMLYEITSLEETIGMDITQANADGSSSSWAYDITARLAQLSQQMTNFNKKIDAAVACGQFVLVMALNDGKIVVVGEKYVGGNLLLPKFKLRQDGSKITTGKKFTDFTGQDLSFKGTYSRPPYEFTGGIAGLSTFLAP